MIPVVTNEQRLVRTRAVYNPTTHSRVQLARIGPEEDVMENAYGDVFYFVSQDNVFVTNFMSYFVFKKREDAIANNGNVTQTDRSRFIQLVGEWTTNCARLLWFAVQELSVRAIRYTATFYLHETTSQHGNRVIRGILRKFLLIRIGRIGHNGDSLQAGIHAVKLDFPGHTNDTQSPGEGGSWTQFFVRVLDGALRANNLAGIEIGDTAAEDIALMNGPRRLNSRRVQKNGEWIKVEQRGAVIAAYRAYIRREFIDLNEVNVVEPDSDAEDDQAPPPPLVQLRALDYDI